MAGVLKAESSKIDSWSYNTSIYQIKQSGMQKFIYIFLTYVPFVMARRI